MKSTGIVRKVDELGRIVLPIELRRTLEIMERDPMEIYVDGGTIILKKYEPDIKGDDSKKYICSICQREFSMGEFAEE
jgi:transcriptional pleiotropic regulator of transition state genes